MGINTRMYGGFLCGHEKSVKLIHEPSPSYGTPKRKIYFHVVDRAREKMNDCESLQGCSTCQFKETFRLSFIDVKAPGFGAGLVVQSCTSTTQ